MPANSIINTCPFTSLPYPSYVYSYCCLRPCRYLSLQQNPKGVGVWSIDTTESDHGYEVVARSQGRHSPGDLACASCGDGIIVYGSCDRDEDCSTNLAPGEKGKLGGSAPVS